MSEPPSLPINQLHHYLKGPVWNFPFQALRRQLMWTPLQTRLLKACITQINASFN